MQTFLAPAPIMVLDTNAVLDWLVFRNPEATALGLAILESRVAWVATVPMREELDHVLARGHLAAWQPDPKAVGEHWARHCAIRPTPAPSGPNPRLRCRDPDDQKFIDLAVACGARWLVSRDRAVLKLARRLHESGVTVIPPGDWRPA